MLPTIEGTSLTELPWQTLTFEEMLEYYDGPRLMLQKTDTGETYLAWWTDADEHTDRWVHIRMGRDRLKAVLSGEMPARAAFEEPEDGRLLVVDREAGGEEPVRIVAAEPSAVPPDTLPMAEARLRVPNTDDLLERMDGKPGDAGARGRNEDGDRPEGTR